MTSVQSAPLLVEVYIFPPYTTAASLSPMAFEVIENQALFTFTGEESTSNHLKNGSVTILLLETKDPPSKPLKTFVARSYVAFARLTTVFIPVEIIVQSFLPPSVVKSRIEVALCVNILWMKPSIVPPTVEVRFS